MKILQFLNKFNKISSECEKHPQLFSTYKGLKKNQIPFSLSFDGTVNWFKTITCSFQSHFLIKDLEAYNYFKKNVNPYNHFSFIELDQRLDQRQLISILEKISVEKLYSQEKIINLVIFDYEDFYLKLGNHNVDKLFLPLIKSSEIQVSLIENGKSIPLMIKSFLSNKIESSGTSFYLNDKIFDPCFSKYQEFHRLTSKSLELNENLSDYYLFDSFQKNNKNEILPSDFVFYENPELFNHPNPSSIPSYPHKRMDINGQYKYAVCLYKDNEFMCVYDLFSKEIGIIDSDKFSKVFKAKVRLVSKSIKKDA